MSLPSPLQPLTTCFDKYVLYESASFFYLIGCDADETQYRILKLNRNIIKPKSLDEILVEDPVVYGGEELEALLAMINDGNKSTGGIKQVTVAYGLVGFVKFLDCYYVTLITQRRKVGCIGSNYIYAIKNTEIFAIRPTESIGNEISLKSMWRKVNKKLTQTNADTAESRYMGLFQFIDTTKDFFFSYTYDLTHSLQHNFVMSSPNSFPIPPFKEMYEWNKYHTEDLKKCLGDINASLWTLPIIHGSFQQRRFSLFGRNVDMILLARRSRHYAGTRYLKRGVSVHGKVANDCEMEQIVQVDNGQQMSYASYVQMRGSIPTYWYQETSVTMPKPPILVDRVDSNFLATQSHFSDLIKRYSLPIIVLDLVKHHERRKRESIVGKDFRHATETINISMPREHQIRYIALDFSRISKAKGGATKAKGDGKLKSNSINATGMEWSKIESSLGKEVGESNGMSEAKKTAVSRSFSAAGKNTADNKEEDGEDFDGDDEEEVMSAPPAGRGDILKELDDISSCTLQETSIFCSTTKHLSALREVDEVHKTKALKRGYLEQRGVLRTNCIDCLDRTNVAQFSMGVRFLTAALHSLGLLDSETLDPSNGMLLGLMDMYSDMGDRIALQYGGSEAHKKVSKGSGKTKQGELLTSIKRYYSNAFTDRVKQDAMNLFLGHFQPSQHNYALWDLESDYFLHNKLLYPPRPEINSILYDGDNDRNQIEESEIEKQLENIRSRKEELLSKYHIREASFTRTREGRSSPFVDHDKIWQRIEKRELMKFRLQKTKVSMRAAEEWWWRMALHEFDSERQWMRLPAPDDMIPTVPYFERVHEVNTLTSFDEELSTDFLRPIDATEASMFSLSSGGRLRSQSKLSDQEREDQRSNDGEHADLDSRSKRIDQESFNLTSFFQKAKSIVGEILHPAAFDAHEGRTLNESRKSSKNSLLSSNAAKTTSKEKSTNAYLSTAEELAIYAKSIQVDESSQRTYVRYCDDFESPEVYIDETTSASRYDFEMSLRPMTVDSNDVSGMVELAASSHVGDVIVSGRYRGMQQQESALLATALSASTLVFVEPELKKSVSQSSVSKSHSHQRPDPVLPLPTAEAIPAEAIERDRDVGDKRSAPLVVDLNSQAKQKMNCILDANTHHSSSSSGLDEEINTNLSKYLFSQNAYAQEVDPARLAKRMSSLTDDKQVVNYISLFTPETIAPVVDEINYITSDRGSSHPLTALKAALEKLEPLRRKHDLLKMFERNGLSENTESKTPSQCRNDSSGEIESSETKEQEEFDSLRLSSNDYPGFTRVGHDLYSKISNPCFVCNESAVAFYLKCRKNMNSMK